VKVFWKFSGFLFLYKNEIRAKGKFRIRGWPAVINKGIIYFDGDVDFRSSVKSTPLGVTNPVFLHTMSSDSTIRLGHGVGVSGAVICCMKSITIGDGVMIGSGAMICDSDFHSLDHRVRRTEHDLEHAVTLPVLIGDNCFIGARSIILKGVELGDRTIVGAGSVVTRSFPSDVVVAGNPARIIKKLNSYNLDG